MNRYAKGAIAAGAGVVLLLGGAGTFALWNDSATIDAGQVNSGQLSLTPDSVTGKWYLYDESAEGHKGALIANVASYPVVPGDKLIYALDAPVTLTAEGGNLYFTLTSTGADLSGIDGATVDVEFAQSTSELGAPVGGVYHVDATDGVVHASVSPTIVVDFPQSVGDAPGTGLQGQNGSIDLSEAASIVVQQVAPPAS